MRRAISQDRIPNSSADCVLNIQNRSLKKMDYINNDTRSIAKNDSIQLN